MIYYIVSDRHRYTMESYLKFWGKPLAHLFTVVSYKDFLAQRALPYGSYIFSDIERLHYTEAEFVAKAYEHINNTHQNVVLLNHPTGSMKRYELLRTLKENGTNEFDVYRITEHRDPVRYPVFIRMENEHESPPLDLINNKNELTAAIQQLAIDGKSRDEWLITEYANTVDEQGLYRKYSAFIVGDKIIARHLFFRDVWMVKGPRVLEEEQKQLEIEYVRDNPHKELLKPIFAAANINYGRIDYAFKNGKIQVWEINTNPMIAVESDGDKRGLVQEIFTPLLNAAFKEINSISYGMW